ncbi:YafY family protein [Reinekea sp. G2M2-21]|uniref:helix-turn-helix transcriptional regulator n=1 Tax=Reinekea sp. G2M2-21 TaxID=2788942 RepID=UPI0018AB0584|nr:YafY family protein [Reinekea sp. G2M2-21]
MSRIDILFQMTQIIRSRPYTTAAYLSDRLNISVRSVYRYVNDLTLAGVPIISQTGKGYWIDKDFDMPPLHLSPEELLALSLGSRLVQAVADPFLADAAQQLLDKVDAVVPHNHRKLLWQTRIHAPAAIIDEPTAARLGCVRQAVEQKQKLSIHYLDANDRTSERVIWPLALAFWGQAWTIAAWCEQRTAFRAFRVDRIRQADRLGQAFPDQPGRTLADFVEQQKAG